MALGKRDAGIDVAIKPWPDGVDVPQLVAVEPMALGCGERNIVLAAQAAGAPIKAVATMFQASPSGLLTHPESGIASLDDLQGKRVGMPINGVRLLNLVKGVNGIADEEIEIVEISYEGTFERVIDGEFAAVRCYVVDEPIGAEAALGVKPTVLQFSDYGCTSCAQVIMTNDQLLATHPDAVRAFLAATSAGWNQALTERCSAEQAPCLAANHRDGSHTRFRVPRGNERGV